MRKTYVIVCILVCGVLSISAQKKNEIQFGLSMPSGDFADDDLNDAIFNGSGYAVDGIYVGYKHLSPLSPPGLSWTLSAGMTYNKLGDDFEDDFEEGLQDYINENVGYGYDLEIKFLKYVNIPVIAGLQYERAIAKNISLFGEFGVGFNVLKLTDLTLSIDGDDAIYKFDPSTKASYKIGGGFLIKGKYSINLTYMNLGSHKVSYTVESSDAPIDDTFSKSLPISNMNLTFGLRF